MLVPRVCAPQVTRWSLGKYWSRDFLQQRDWVAGCQGDGVIRQPILGYTGYLWLIVRGSEIWWCMHSAHSLSTTLRTYKVISNSLLSQLWSVQPVMPCIWALYPCAGDQFRRTDPHNHTTTSPTFATAGAPCKIARFPSWTVNISTYLTTSCIGLFQTCYQVSLLQVDL